MYSHVWYVLYTYVFACICMINIFSHNPKPNIKNGKTKFSSYYSMIFNKIKGRKIKI